jgi:hypothetical protein
MLTFSSKPNSSKSLTNILPARIGPTVCELLGPTIDGEWAVKSDMRSGTWDLPPILKRSKVEITACSGLSGLASTLDLESPFSWTLCDRVVMPALMFLDGRVRVNGGVIRNLSREVRYGQREIC